MENNSAPPRLRTTRDFRRVQENGKTMTADKWLVLSVLANSTGKLRVGWTLPRYVGNSVIRNRLKRWLRVAICDLPTEDKQRALDINFIFRNRGPQFYREMSHESFRRVIFGTFKRFSQSHL